MDRKEISILLEKQRDYYRTGATLSPEFRIEQLNRLYDVVRKYEKEIEEALRSDLGKSPYESYMCETGITLSEITYMKKHLKKFSRKKRVRTPLAQFPAVSYTQAVPYGNTLIMSPWNYPLLLSLEPLVDAISAGNTAIVKPSAYSPATGRVVKQIIEETFSPEFVAVVTGGREENSALLEMKFDLVFFTGSQAVGREVLRHTAEHLTPAVLELGGKSPCIVDETANISMAAKRIVFGKYLNCGQTCVAPDYVLCDRRVSEAFIKAVTEEIRKQYGDDPFDNENYGRIINDKHYERLMSLIPPEKIVCGGEGRRETRQIAPTVLRDITDEDDVMKEEIFGPILPVIIFDSFDEEIRKLKGKAKPLALYLFSENKARMEKVSGELSYGGGCINDVIIHLATSDMAFGGVGESGMGAYHGKAGFDAFSHHKSIVKKSNLIDLPMRYQPYRKGYVEKLVHLFLR